MPRAGPSAGRPSPPLAARAQLRPVRAVEPAGPAGLDRARRRHPPLPPAAPLAREVLLRHALIEEVPREPLARAGLAVDEEPGVVRPEAERAGEIAARLAVRD